jgi:hypothetical protein
MGHPERVEWFDSPLPHGLTYGFRVAIYNWFLRWLKGAPPIAEEPEVAPEPDEKLWVSPGGSVVKAYGGETPFTMLSKRKLERQPTPLAGLLGADPPASPKLSVLGKTEFRSVTVEAIEVPSAPEVWVAGYLYRPKSGSPRRVIVLLDPAGRGQWQENGLYDSLASQGLAVCALDVRGIGDMSPEYPRGAARHSGAHRSEQHYSWTSMILGRPLVGQRAADIVAAVRALRAIVPGGVTVAARGTLATPALFAAALEPAIDALYLAGGLVSYANVLQHEEYLGGNYHDPGNRVDFFGAFVPNILRHTDLPEVAASAAPRRIVLAGPIDAAGKPVDPAAARQIYASARNVAVTPGAAWTVEALSGAA